MKNLDAIRPKTLASLKRKAKQVAKAKGVPLNQAQKLCAVEMGFNSFKEACQKLPGRAA